LTRCGGNQPLERTLSQPTRPGGAEGERAQGHQDEQRLGFVVKHSSRYHQ